MPEPIWQQRPTENHYGTRHAGASVAVIETMFDTYTRLIVEDRPHAGANVPASGQTSEQAESR